MVVLNLCFMTPTDENYVLLDSEQAFKVGKVLTENQTHASPIILLTQFEACAMEGKIVLLEDSIFSWENRTRRNSTTGMINKKLRLI